jgi:hypothetical protein
MSDDFSWVEDMLKPAEIDPYVDQPIQAVRGDAGARHKIHMGYHAGNGYASLCGFRNGLIGKQRHAIWTPIDSTAIDCEECYAKAKAIHEGKNDDE